MSGSKVFLNIKRKNRITLYMLILLLLLAFFISFTLGRYGTSPLEVGRILAWNIADKFGLAGLLGWEGGFDEVEERIVLLVRLPRILASMAIGASLSVAGASYQAVFRNPMVSPDILGATSSAGFGASLALLLSVSYVGVSFSAFFMSLASLVLVFLISSMFRGDRTLGLVLSGIMVSSLFSSGISFIKLVADTERTLPEITYWLMGSLQAVKMDELKIAALPMAVGILLILLFRWKINAFTMGEDEARALGINTTLLRAVIIASATLITAASVAISGIIGWVGLVIPHIVRFLVGEDYSYVLPASAVFGAMFLLIVDDVSRNLYTTEIPIGILTSLIGVPFFMYLMIKGGKKWTI